MGSEEAVTSMLAWTRAAQSASPPGFVKALEQFAICDKARDSLERDFKTMRNIMNAGMPRRLTNDSLSRRLSNDLG